MRGSWTITQVVPKRNHMYPYKKGAEGKRHAEEKGAVWAQRQR